MSKILPDGYEPDYDTIADNSHALFEACRQITAITKLDDMGHLLVIARVAHIHEQGIRRHLKGEDLADYERLRAEVIKRAEAARDENLALEATGINAEGGSA